MNATELALDSFQCTIDRMRKEHKDAKKHKAVIITDFFSSYSIPLHHRLLRACVRFLDRWF